LSSERKNSDLDIEPELAFRDDQKLKEKT